MTFPMKSSVLDDFPLCPPAQTPSPLKSANFYFYCRLAFSEKIPFNCTAPLNCRAARGSLRKAQFIGLGRTLTISHRTPSLQYRRVPGAVHPQPYRSQTVGGEGGGIATQAALGRVSRYTGVSQLSVTNRGLTGHWASVSIVLLWASFIPEFSIALKTGDRIFNTKACAKRVSPSNLIVTSASSTRLPYGPELFGATCSSQSCSKRKNFNFGCTVEYVEDFSREISCGHFPCREEYHWIGNHYAINSENILCVTTRGV